MDNYNQFMKHWKNHKKDRFHQQCSGRSGINNGSDAAVTEEQEAQNSTESMNRILLETSSFPVYIKQGYSGFWSSYEVSVMSAKKINSMAELEQFAKEFA